MSEVKKLEEVAQKEVRAIKEGFWGGHLRRIGAIFYVLEHEVEHWFEPTVKAPAPEVEPKPADFGQSGVRGTSFIDVMQVLAEQKGVVPDPTPVPQTLAQAAASGVLPPAAPAAGDGSDLT